MNDDKYLCILCCKPCDVEVVPDLDRGGEVTSDCCGAEPLMPSKRSLNDDEVVAILEAYWQEADDEDAYNRGLSRLRDRGGDE